MAGGGCCQEQIFDGASRAFRRALLAVIAINAAMFVVDMSAGLTAGSQALQADALDFLADTATYALSLWAVGRSLKTRAMTALIKGASLSVMGLWVFGSTLYHTVFSSVPVAEVMGGVALLALAANVASVGILLRFRSGDANVRSVWLCSRNDAIGNIAVIAAAAGIWAGAGPWPDLAVAGAMAMLFIDSSVQIVRQALGELRQPHGSAAAQAAE